MSKTICAGTLGAILFTAAMAGSALATGPSDALTGSRLHHALDVVQPAGGDKGVVALGDLSITAVFSRATVGRSGAAYLVVTNDGDAADRLIGADAPVAAKVELHNMTVVDDVMRMAPVEGGIEIPPHGSVILAPGGLHVMMMGLSGPLEEGSSFPLTLTFEQAGAVTVDVPVMAADAEGMDMHDMN